MDHHVRVMARATKAPLHEVIRMATLTPATMLGRQNELGQLLPGTFADLVVLDGSLRVVDVWIGGRRLPDAG
jgi:N-acetylglucosamine-6-phosphate deacetylase